MYKGKNVVTVGQQTVGENISFSHITGYTDDFERDESVPTIQNIIIDSKIEDITKQDRQLLEGRYNVNKLLKLRLPKDSIIAIEDFFTHNSKTYTVVRTLEPLNERIIFSEYDQRN